jgi:cytoskeletal protein CcmA (bactofilin family)
MFGNKSNKQQNRELDSLVGGSTRVRGDVHFSGGLHIDGVVKGNVVAESDGSMLTTSDKGRIEGDVRVHNIVLNGDVIGDVYSTQHIELAPNAKVTGNVYYNVIEMSMGAEVNGSLIHMYEEGGEPIAGAEKKSA